MFGRFISESMHLVRLSVSFVMAQNASNLTEHSHTVSCRDGDDGSDSGTDESADSDEDGHKRKRRRGDNESLGLFDTDFYEQEFSKRRKVFIDMHALELTSSVSVFCVHV